MLFSFVPDYSFRRKGETPVDTEIRMGFVGIVVERKDEIAEVNRVLSLFSDMIRGRIGVPNQADNSAVIGLIVEGTNARVGALTGKLGNISGITVKSALTAKKTSVTE